MAYYGTGSFEENPRSLKGLRGEQYKSRLEDVYGMEKDQLASLQSEADMRRQQLAGTQVDYGTRALYGAGMGGGAAGLRGASYASGDMSQGVANDAAAQKALDDEAFRRMQLELRARRGQYGLMGMQGAGELSDYEKQLEAEEAEDNYKKKKQEDAETWGWAGTAAGAVGAGMSAASDERLKKNVRTVSDERSKRKIEDVGLASYIEGRRDQRDEMRQAPEAPRRSLAAPAPPPRPVIVQALDWWGQNIVGPISEQLPGSAARTYEGSEAKRRLHQTPALQQSDSGRFATPRVEDAEADEDRIRALAQRQRSNGEPMATYQQPKMPPKQSMSDERMKTEMPRDDGVREQHDPAKALKVIQRGLRMFGGHPVELSMSDERLKSLVSALGDENEKLRSQLEAQGPVRTEGRQRPDVGAPTMNETRSSGTLPGESDYEPPPYYMTKRPRRAVGYQSGGSESEDIAARMDAMEREDAADYSALVEQRRRNQAASGRATGARKSPADQRAAQLGSELDREDDETLRTLRGHTYEYTPEAQDQYGVEPGPQYGVMAQDVASTPLGATMVRQMPDGMLALDQDAVTRAVPALVGRVAERQDDTEGRLASIESALRDEDANTLAKLRRGGRVEAPR